MVPCVALSLHTSLDLPIVFIQDHYYLHLIVEANGRYFLFWTLVWLEPEQNPALPVCFRIH